MLCTFDITFCARPDLEGAGVFDEEEDVPTRPPAAEHFVVLGFICFVEMAVESFPWNTSMYTLF